MGNGNAVERRVFRSVATAVVGFPVGDDVADTAFSLIANLPRRDRLQLRLLLRALRVATLLGNNLGSVVERWLSSNIAALRRAAAGLKALAALATYATPSSWSIPEYDGPWLGKRTVPVLSAPAVLTAENQFHAGVIYGRAARKPVRLHPHV